MARYEIVTNTTIYDSERNCYIPIDDDPVRPGYAPNADFLALQDEIKKDETIMSIDETKIIKPTIGTVSDVAKMMRDKVTAIKAKDKDKVK